MGTRAKPIDDAVSTVQCVKGFTMVRCECDRKEACDGAWVRVDAKGDSFCDAYNRADNKQRNVKAVVVRRLYNAKKIEANYVFFS